MKYLVTGGTGFIGKKIVDQLLKGGHQIVILSRHAPHEVSKNKNLEYLIIDLAENLEPYYELNTVMKDVDAVIHAAALYDLQASYVKSYLTNIVGTSNLIELVKKFPNIKEFHYLSTIAVNPFNQNQVISEDFLDPNSPDQDAYAKSKHQAELIVRRAANNHLKIRIYRPGIVIADSTQNFSVEKADGPYLLLKSLFQYENKFALLGFFPLLFFPYSRKAFVHFIPVDILSNWLCTMITDPRGDEEVLGFHLFGDQAYSTEKFLRKTLNFFEIKSKIIPLPNFITPIRKKLKLKKVQERLPIPLEILDYMFNSSIYSFANRKKYYPELSEFNFADHIQDFLNGAKSSMRIKK